MYKVKSQEGCSLSPVFSPPFTPTKQGCHQVSLFTGTNGISRSPCPSQACHLDSSIARRPVAEMTQASDPWETAGEPRTATAHAKSAIFILLP